MPQATGWFRVETEVDLADYDGEYDIEFDGLADIIETAELNGHSKEEIIDYCFDEGRVSPEKFMTEYMSHETIMKVYHASITEKMDELRLTISNREDRIRELEAKLEALENKEDLKEEAN